MEGEALDEAPDTSQAPKENASVAETSLFVVYGVLFLPLSLFVYVGSTRRGDQRTAEHSNFRGGARRIAVAFAQAAWQPLADFFEFRELWSGNVTTSQAKAIEQFFMDKHETLITKRPTNGICKDIDLMKGEPPRQLNTIRSCRDEPSVEWARQRVCSDSAIVVKTPTQLEHIRHCMELERVELESCREQVVSIVLEQELGRYSQMESHVEVTPHDVQGSLNRVFGAIRDDDAPLGKRECKDMLLKFAVDRNVDETTWRSDFVASCFETLMIAFGFFGGAAKRMCTEAAAKAEIAALKQRLALSGARVAPDPPTLEGLSCPSSLPATVAPPDIFRALDARLRPRAAGDCAKCHVARTDPEARLCFSADAGRGHTRNIGATRACPLFEHGVAKRQLADLLPSSLSDIAKRHKVEAFMLNHHGVTPLGKPDGKRPHRVSLYNEQGQTVDGHGNPLTSGQFQHQDFYQGFRID